MKGKEEIKKIVKLGYARIAKEGSSCCLPFQSCCEDTSAEEISKKRGYTEEEIKQVPEGSNLGLGCGNPVALASLREGDIVLDLGSGAGLDCFLAARKVGRKGKVIGVDMTPEMVERARKNAEKGGYENVEFRLGEIEDLPVEDNSVDVIISNCVINLSPDKKKVFEEAFRVLKPSGRLIITDLVLLKELPDFVKESVEAYVGCISGAVLKEDYIKLIEGAGFKNVEIIEETPFPLELMANDSTPEAVRKGLKTSSEKIKMDNIVVSIKIKGVKPDSKS